MTENRKVGQLGICKSCLNKKHCKKPKSCECEICWAND